MIYAKNKLFCIAVLHYIKHFR